MKTILRTLMILACCAGLLVGCSEDQSKKQEKTGMSKQEQMGKEAAQALKQPVEDAKKAAAEVSGKADQALKEVAGDAKKAIENSNLIPGQAASKEKKKQLEGC
jgi:hypothetical protein